MSRGRLAAPRRILITGATGSHGSALARLYAGRGVSLALHGRDATRLERLAEDCRRAGAEVERLLEVNLVAAIALTEALLPGMRAAGRGQVALVSSLSAYFGLPLTPSYCASKAGLMAYGEALRGWLAPQGVAVNVVLPGFVRSAMSDRFPGPRPFMLSPERAAGIIRRGLARDKARIAFPIPLSWAMWWLAVLPVDLATAILRRTGYAGAADRPET
jgi:short-subunit dehydrogenase